MLYRSYPKFLQDGSIVVAGGLITFCSFYYGIRKLSSAWYYEIYKEEQSKKIKKCANVIININKNFLTPLNSIFSKLKNAIKENAKIILKEEKEFKQLMTNTVA